MIAIHNTTVYATPGNAERVDIVHEAVQMLVDYAGCSVVSRDTNWEDYYDTVIDAGGDVAYRVRIYVPGGNWRQSLQLHRGYVSGGEFVSLESTSTPGLNTPSGSERDQYATLYSVNGGDAWHLQFAFYWNDGGAGFRYNTVRSVRLMSALSGADVITGFISSYSSGRTATQLPFPCLDAGVGYRDYIHLNGGDYVVQCVQLPNAKNNIEAGKILLFPSLIYVEATDNNLGVPTIGDGRTYYMGIPDGVSLPAYTEITVNGGRYVSLGNIAIPST